MSVTTDRAAIDEELVRLAEAEGKSIEELAAERDADGDGQIEMFPQGTIPGDAKVTLKNIAPAGTGRKHEAKMRATAIPMTSGLVRYGEKLELLVTVEAGQVKEVPELDEADSSGKRKLTGVKDVQEFRPIFVQDGSAMFTREQVIDLMAQAGVPDEKVAELLP